MSTTVVTRWHLMELMAGVCDLQIWPIISERRDDLVLQPRLHAKIALSDSEAIAGSANITGAALGWTSPPNEEVILPAFGEYLRELESMVKRLADTGVLVDDDIYNEFYAQLDKAGGVIHSEPEPSMDDVPENATPWMPATRDPADLEALYFGNHHRLTESATQAAASDLVALEIPPLLTSDLFHAHLSMQLLLHPLVRKLERELATPRRFGEVLQIVRRWSGEAREPAAERLQTLMRWLLHFQADRWQYQKTRYSECLVFVGQKATSAIPSID
ncbi:MAG: hypothetical protein F4138_02460 [Acidimicrobiia bacterium]|nr:hypothetical protein [Acidimicrobiia bacterium]